MLLLVYTFNFLDRQILGILAPAIKADLHLSDAEFGAVGGLAFAMLYSVLGVPLALLADRTSRVWVIAGSLTIWSGFTALCGTATGFGQLFLYRLGVGVGEAGGVAPSYALIADYFPPQSGPAHWPIYSLGIPIGLAGGTLLGAYIASAIEWRTAFYVVGLAGVRHRADLSTDRRAIPSREPVTADTRAAARRLSLARRKAGLLADGVRRRVQLADAAMVSRLWAPSVLIRSFHFDLIQTGQFMGSLLLIGGTIGVFAGGWLADRLGPADHGWYAKLPAIAWLITAPSFAAGMLSGARRRSPGRCC